MYECLNLGLGALQSYFCNEVGLFWSGMQQRRQDVRKDSFEWTPAPNMER